MLNTGQINEGQLICVSYAVFVYNLIKMKWFFSAVHVIGQLSCVAVVCLHQIFDCLEEHAQYINY